MRTFCLGLIKAKNLDIGYVGETYPAMNIQKTLKEKEKDLWCVQFLRDILSSCNTTTSLALKAGDPLEWIVRNIKPRLTHVACIESESGTQHEPIQGIESCWIKELWTLNRTRLRDLHSLNLINLSGTGKNVDLSQLFGTEWPMLSSLNLLGTTLENVDLDKLYFTGMKKLPKLTSLCLTIPHNLKKETLNNLFSVSSWRQLKSFYVQLCDNDQEVPVNKINKSLRRAVKKGKLNKLVDFGLWYKSELPIGSNKRIRTDKLEHLKSLVLYNCILPVEFLTFQTNISKLDIRKCEHLAGKVSQLMLKDFPSLDTLVLQDCGLKSMDIRCLANEGKGLQKLTHLDISCNELTKDDISCLFMSDYSCKWKQLLTLDIRTPNEVNVTDFINDLVGTSKFLISLQELGIYSYDNRDTLWPTLNKLHLTTCSRHQI